MILQGKRKDKKEERLKATALQFVKKQTCHDKENKPLLRI
jgi:hypothetical protein